MSMKRIILILALMAAPAFAAEQEPIDFAQALHQRTERAIFHISSRIPYTSGADLPAWAGISFGDVWVGELVDDNVVVYTLKSRPEYTIRLENIQPDDVATLELGKPITVSEKDEEVRITDVNVAGGYWENTVTHQFAKTTTLQEAHKAGFELALEVTAGYTPGAATGGGAFEAKFSAKAHYEYNKTTTDSSTTTDTETRVIKLGPGDTPFVGYIEARRSIAKISRTSSAAVAFEHTIQLQRNGVTDYSWNSWAELMRVMKGVAPTNRALAAEFKKSPLAPQLVDRINDFPIPRIEWETLYDGVVKQSIEIIRTVPKKETAIPAYQLNPSTPLGEPLVDLQPAVVVTTYSTKMEKRKAKRKANRGARRAARRAAREASTGEAQ